MDIKNLIIAKGHSGFWIFRGSNEKSGMLWLEDATGEKPSMFVKRVDCSPVEGYTIFMADGESISLEDVFNNLIAIEDAGRTVQTKDVSEADLIELMHVVAPGFDSTRFKPFHMRNILKWYGWLMTCIDRIADIK